MKLFKYEAKGLETLIKSKEGWIYEWWTNQTKEERITPLQIDKLRDVTYLKRKVQKMGEKRQGSKNTKNKTDIAKWIFQKLICRDESQ